MLRGTKATSLNYTSVINEKIVATYNAQVPEDGKTVKTRVIVDTELYEANKRECRADEAAFNELVYETEDERQQTGLEGDAE